MVNLNSNPPPNLSKVPLARDDKLKLLEFAHLPGKGYKDVVEKYSLNYNTLRAYYKKFKRNASVNAARGRPRKLDSESMEYLSGYLQSHVGCSRYDLYREIRLQNVQTCNRRCPDGFNPNYRLQISRISVYRYADVLLQQHNVNN